MKRRDQAFALVALAIGLFLWPIIGWQFGSGVGLLGLGIVNGIFAWREERDSDVYLKQVQDVMIQVVKQTTERETANIVRACLEHALQMQQSNPGEKGH